MMLTLTGFKTLLFKERFLLRLAQQVPGNKNVTVLIKNQKKKKKKKKKKLFLTLARINGFTSLGDFE